MLDSPVFLDIDRRFYQDLSLVSERELQKMDKFLHKIWSSDSGFMAEVYKTDEIELDEIIIILINIIAYKNRKDIDLENGVNELECTLSMLSEKRDDDIKEFNKSISDSFAMFFNKCCYSSKDGATLLNFKKSYIDDQAFKEGLFAFTLKDFFYKWDSKLKTILSPENKRLYTNLQGMIRAIEKLPPAPSNEDYKDLYEQIWNYYYQTEQYITISEKGLETKAMTWAANFGQDLEDHLTNQRKNYIKNKPSNIMILGETGTGKEMLARAVGRKDIIPQNLAAIAKGFLEYTLFGVGPGVATGVPPILGLFLTACGYEMDKTKDPKSKKYGQVYPPDKSKRATIFLDEIGEIPIDIQVKLLRIIEEQEISRVGEMETHKISIKVISATNQPIYKMLQEGTFRRDLFERIANGGVIETYPLVDRPEDIWAISQKYSKKSGVEVQNHTYLMGGLKSLKIIHGLGM